MLRLTYLDSMSLKVKIGESPPGPFRFFPKVFRICFIFKENLAYGTCRLCCLLKREAVPVYCQLPFVLF